MFDCLTRVEAIEFCPGVRLGDGMPRGVPTRFNNINNLYEHTNEESSTEPDAKNERKRRKGYTSSVD